MCKQLSRRTWLLQMGFVCLAAILVLTVTVVVVIGQQTNSNHECRGQLKCMKISECSEDLNLDFNYECSNDKAGRARICCIPGTISTSGNVPTVNSRLQQRELLPEECGISANANKIANGVDAAIGQFPWMALLGYTTKKINIAQYLCGGTVINQRYILTAAHCTVIKSMKLSTIRLGELNLQKNPDCEDQGGTEYCADPPVDMEVESVVRHTGYNNITYKHDIALVRLVKNISEFNDFMQPVCLPFNVKAEGKYMTTKKFLISGWGKTSSSSVGVSTVLQYTTVSGWETNRCNKVLPVKVRLANATQICATGKNFQEACKGDSGGPLTDDISDGGILRTYQIGIVSFKSLNTCGTEDLPTVFTRVDHYLDWILDNISN